MAPLLIRVFFFNYTATTEIYTLSLHDALPICDVCDPVDWLKISASGVAARPAAAAVSSGPPVDEAELAALEADRKNKRLNSSHANISYAAFCLKSKKLGQYDDVTVRSTGLQDR